MTEQCEIATGNFVALAMTSVSDRRPPVADRRRARNGGTSDALRENNGR